MTSVPGHLYRRGAASLRSFLARYLVSLSGGGGGGTAPAWLPSGAVAYADFVNGHYYAGGAETTLSDMWVEFLDWGPFDPAGVTPGTGFTGGGYPTAGAWFSALSAGATVVIDGTLTTSQNTSINCDLYNSDYSIDSHVSQAGDAGSADTNGGDPAITLPGVTGPLRYAFTTLLDGSLSVSVGGAAVQSVAGDAGAFTGMTVYSSDSAVLKTVTIYPPQADADLPALSTLP